MGKSFVTSLRRYLPLCAGAIPWFLGIGALALYAFGAPVKSDMVFGDRANTDWASLFLAVSVFLSFVEISFWVYVACLHGLQRRFVVAGCCNLGYLIIVIAAVSPIIAMYFFLFCFVVAMSWALAFWMARH